MKANKIWHINVFARIFIKRFRKDCLTGQQLFDIHGLPDDPLETMHSRLNIIVICIESPALGLSHSISTPESNGVPPLPQNPTMTPAIDSIRMAACVMDVPVPNSSTVVLAIGIFQY